MIYSNKDLSKKLERTEARTNADFVETRAKMFPESRAEWIEVGGAYAMFDAPESPLTQTFGLGLFEEITDTELEKLEDFFKQRNAPVFHEVSPMADASLLELLNKRGYQPVELTSVMYLPLEEKTFSGSNKNERINVRIIEKDEEKIWAQTSAEAWSNEDEELRRIYAQLRRDQRVERGRVSLHRRIGRQTRRDRNAFHLRRRCHPRRSQHHSVGASPGRANRPARSPSPLRRQSQLPTGNDGRITQQPIPTQRRIKRFSYRLHAHQMAA